MKLPREIAGFDSASVMTMALARFLRGLGVPPVGNPAYNAMRPVAAFVGRMPVPVREFVFSWFSGYDALAAPAAAALDFDAVSAKVATVYPRRRYPAVAVGSSGGALIHLCAAMGVPWLPQTLLVPVRQETDLTDDPLRAEHAFDATAQALLDRNPDVALHYMHDPNQDRLALRRIAYFRVKRIRLGPAYERFLTDVLEPGGTILLAECGHRWPTTRLGDRHVFQVGGFGGMPPPEYHTGSLRVADYLRRYRAGVQRWPTPVPDTDSPEAEWGFEPGLRDDVMEFADRHGFRVRRLVSDDAEALSPVVADLYRWWHTERGLPADRLVIDSFFLLDPWWTLRVGAVPYWSVFPVQPSADALCRYLDGVEPYDHLQLGLFCHGVTSVGLATVEQWREVLARARVSGRFAGVVPHRYPVDPQAFDGYLRALRATPGRYPLPASLPLDALETFLHTGADRYPRVRLIG
jgi:hypothetical protein